MEHLAHGLSGGAAFAAERDGLTIRIAGRDVPGEFSEVSISRSEAAAVVEMICKNAGLPAPWTGATP